MKIRLLLAQRARPRKLGYAFKTSLAHLSIGPRCFSIASFGRQNGFVHATVKCAESAYKPPMTMGTGPKMIHRTGELNEWPEKQRPRRRSPRPLLFARQAERLSQFRVESKLPTSLQIKSPRREQTFPKVGDLGPKPRSFVVNVEKGAGKTSASSANRNAS